MNDNKIRTTIWMKPDMIQKMESLQKQERIRLQGCGFLQRVSPDESVRGISLQNASRGDERRS